MNLQQVDLAHYKSLRKWDPRVGDCVVWHGWLTHWFGVVSSVIREENKVEIVKKGIPALLFSMTPEEYKKNSTKVDIGEIKGSTGGRYATIRAQGNNIVWFV
jgi:hypothetical protein